MQTEVRRVDAQTDGLRTVYEFREPEAVRAYLTANPDLLPLVREAAAKLRSSLPGDGNLAPEVVRDIEDEADPGEIFALFQTRLDPAVVRPPFNRLTEEWLVEAGRLAVGRFNINLEYR